jgi:hypothetical protein
VIAHAFVSSNSAEGGGRGEGEREERERGERRERGPRTDGDWMHG